MKPNANIKFGVSIIQKIILTLNNENCILGNLEKIPPQLNVFEVDCFNLKSVVNFGGRFVILLFYHFMILLCKITGQL